MLRNWSELTKLMFTGRHVFRGSAVRPQPDVAHYYIQRHAEAGVAFVHITGNHSGATRGGQPDYFEVKPITGSSPQYGQLIAYFSFSPARSTKSFGAPFTRCSVNGQRIKLPRDSVFAGHYE